MSQVKRCGEIWYVVDQIDNRIYIMAKKKQLEHKWIDVPSEHYEVHNETNN